GCAAGACGRERGDRVALRAASLPGSLLHAAVDVGGPERERVSLGSAERACLAHESEKLLARRKRRRRARQVLVGRAIPGEQAPNHRHHAAAVSPEERSEGAAGLPVPVAQSSTRCPARAPESWTAARRHPLWMPSESSSFAVS